MNRGRVVGGVVCLALAVLLAALSAAFPGKVAYFVEGENMPWIPPIVFGVVGIVLLASARIGRQEVETRAPRAEIVIDEEKSALNKRLETIGWGCFLIMLGGFALVPRTVVAKGFWSIGVGIIMLGLNAARYLNRIKMSGFTTFLGVISLVGGILQLMGMEAIEGAFLLIVLGAFLLVKPWFDKRHLFGKAEES